MTPSKAGGGMPDSNPPIRIESFKGRRNGRHTPVAAVPDHDGIGMDDRPPFEVIAPAEITEDGVALVFERRHAGSLLFDHDIGAWFVWQGQCWRRETTQLAFEWARQAARDVSVGSKDGKRATASKSGFAGGVERFARSTRTFATIANEWDRSQMLLGTPDGTVDLVSGIMRLADPGDRITKSTAVAPSSTADCPIWIRFLDEATGGDRDLMRYLQQILGYGLTGDTREQCLFFAHGDGGNGKGVFVNVTKAVMGEYAINAAMDTFVSADKSRHTTELARLQGARFVTASETEEGRAWAEARIKQLTGGDEITARFMRMDDFTFRPEFKLFIIGNHKPSLHNVDEAMKRRFNLIPFVNKPKVKNLQLEEELKAEWPAILRWMIEGCLDWQRNGLVRPDAVVKETDEYFRSQDLLGQWIEDRCDVDKSNPKVWDVKSKLYASWKTYCERAGEKPNTVKIWKEAMENRHFYEKKKNFGVCMEGVMLRSGDSDGGEE